MNAAYDYYKNLYLSLYGDANQSSQSSVASDKPSKLAGILNKQDLDLTSIIGPETSVSYIEIYHFYSLHSFFSDYNDCINNFITCFW